MSAQGERQRALGNWTENRAGSPNRETESWETGQPTGNVKRLQKTTINVTNNNDKMKKFAVLAIMAVYMSASFAQNVDGGAADLLKKVALQYQKYATLQFHYTLKTTKDDKTLGVSEGDFCLKGSKYKTTFSGVQYFCDGQSIWSYDKSAKEVSVYEYDPEDDGNLMNPQRILKGWDKQFRAKFIRDEFSNNVQYSIVDLTPKTAQSFYRIRVYIGKTSLKIAKIAVYEKDNTIYTYSIEQFKHDIPLDDKMFVFDVSKYPGVEVNDMR